MAGLLISIRRGISIEGALPNTQAGVSVSATLTADGTQYGVNWSMSGTLPPGWAVNYAGTTATITGVATTAGNYTMTFRAVDGRGYEGSRTYTVRITEADELHAIDGDLIAPRDTLGPLSTVGEAYSATITPIGGVPPYTWTHVSGSLASGLSFSTSTGKITGTPSAQDVTSKAHYTLSDSASHSIDVVLGPFALNMAIDGSPPAGTRGMPYSYQFAAIGGHDHTWSITSGTLPQGLTLQPDGTLQGVPEVTTTGTSVTVKCDSAGGATASKTVTLVIDAATITVDVDTPSTATVGEQYWLPFYASGGSGAYTADIVSGSLPSGFDLTSNQALRPPVQIRSVNVPSGSSGSHSVTVRVSDAFGNYADVPITINVIVASLTLDAQYDGQWTGEVGSTFNRLEVKAIYAHGGLAPFAWTLDSGAIPPGLTLAGDPGSYAYLQGTPSTAGIYTATIRATDSQSPADTATADITVTINP